MVNTENTALAGEINYPGLVCNNSEFFGYWMRPCTFNLHAFSCGLAVTKDTSLQKDWKFNGNTFQNNHN